MGALLTSGILSTSTFLVAAADTTAEGGTDYAGIALIISAVAALVTAVGGVLLGLRRTSGDEIDRELKRLLADKLREEADEEPP